VVNGVILAISVMGNRGTFTKPLREIVKDFDFIYPIGYVTISLLGLVVHEFFYSLIVSYQRQRSHNCFLFKMVNEISFAELSASVD